jgi:hypothetical protein
MEVKKSEGLKVLKLLATLGMLVICISHLYETVLFQYEILGKLQELRKLPGLSYLGVLEAIERVVKQTERSFLLQSALSILGVLSLFKILKKQWKNLNRY